MATKENGKTPVVWSAPFKWIPVPTSDGWTVALEADGMRLAVATYEEEGGSEEEAREYAAFRNKADFGGRIKAPGWVMPSR